MTQEYLRAAQTYKFSYTDLKRMARQSLEHSFLPGESVWTSVQELKARAPCADMKEAGERPSANCQKLLESSEKAHQQWRLEEAFAKFESKAR